MWTVDFIETASSNCVDNMMASMAKLMCEHHQLYNIKYFYIKYFYSSSKKIIRTSSYDFIDNVLGMKFEFINIKDLNLSFWDAIIANINISPVGVMIDPYDCYWSPFYKKNHWYHMVLILNINKVDKKLTCFDAYYPTIGYIDISINDLEAIANRIVTFKFRKSTHNYVELSIDYIKDIIKNHDTKSSEKEMAEFSDFIKNELKPSEISQDGNFATSKFLLQLLWVVEDRNNFIFGLKYLENLSGNQMFNNVYQLLEYSYKQFMLLKTILMKYSITQKMNKEKIDSIMQEIYKTDMLIISELQKAFKGVNL